MKNLNQIEELKKNWDGYGALPISQTVVSNTLDLIAIIQTHTPHLLDVDITPLSNGTVSVEWETNNGIAYLEIGNTLYSGFIQIDDKKPIFLEGQTNSINKDFLESIYHNLFSLSHHCCK